MAKYEVTLTVTVEVAEDLDDADLEPAIDDQLVDMISAGYLYEIDDYRPA